MNKLTKLAIAMMFALTAAACTNGADTSYRSSTAQGSYYFEQLDN